MARMNDDGTMAMDSAQDVQSAVQAIIDFCNNTDPDSLDSPDRITLGLLRGTEGATMQTATDAIDALLANAGA